MSTVNGGVSEDPTSVVFTHILGDRQAIRRGGGGTQAHINPLPPGCNHHRNVHHARSKRMYSIFSLAVQAPVFFTRVLGDRRAIRRGGGGAQAYINPLPPGCDHCQKLLSRVLQHRQLIKTQGWRFALSLYLPTC
jgi:hypothetical protein